jgi:CheY-like chemotaxis protein
MTTGLKAVVVEDDTDLQYLYRLKLEREGFTVATAANGVDGLKIAEEFAPDIILLDLMMPVMNGWDFRRKQREMVDLARIPVLLMSAGAHMDAASGDLDVVGFMSKPVEVEDLLAKVKKHCA